MLGVDVFILFARTTVMQNGLWQQVTSVSASSGLAVSSSLWFESTQFYGCSRIYQQQLLNQLFFNVFTELHLKTSVLTQQNTNNPA